MYLNEMMPDLRSLAMLIGKLLTDDSFSRESRMSNHERSAARQQLLHTILPKIKVSFELSACDLDVDFKVTPIMRRISEILEPVLPAKHFLDIRLALEEIVSNIIEHSYENQHGDIIFRFTITSHDIHIEVEDFGEKGKTYDITHVGQYESLEELRKTTPDKNGGMGVFLVRKIMDEVRYDVLPGIHNKITMKKTLV